MARFPKTLGDALAAQADLARIARTETLSVDPLAPIGLGQLDSDLKDNLDTLDRDLAQLGQDKIELDAALADLTSDLAANDQALEDAKQDIIDLGSDFSLIREDLTQRFADLDQSLINLGFDLSQLDEDLKANDELIADLTSNVGNVDQKIISAITESESKPITNERFTEDSLTIWPFIQGLIPSRALAPGAVGADDLDDFVITVRKFNDDRHRIY